MFQIASTFAIAKSLNTWWCLNTSRHTLMQGNQAATYLDNIFAKVPAVTPERLALIQHIESHYQQPRVLLHFPHWQYVDPLTCVDANTHYMMLDSTLQSYKYFEQYRADVLELFKLEGTQAQLLHQLAAEYLGEPNKTFNLSVHIRRGDYQQLATVFKLLDQPYYLKALDTLADKLTQAQQAQANPNEKAQAHAYAFPTKTIRLIVFSDNPEYVQEHFSWPQKLTIAGTDYPLEPVYIPTSVPDYLALHLQARCQHHIIGNSTFSWWGAYLNPQPHLTIAPKWWFVETTHLRLVQNRQLTQYIDPAKAEAYRAKLKLGKVDSSNFVAPKMQLIVQGNQVTEQVSLGTEQQQELMRDTAGILHKVEDLKQAHDLEITALAKSEFLYHPDFVIVDDEPEWTALVEQQKALQDAHEKT